MNPPAWPCVYQPSALPRDLISSVPQYGGSPGTRPNLLANAFLRSNRTFARLSRLNRNSLRLLILVACPARGALQLCLASAAIDGPEPAHAQRTFPEGSSTGRCPPAPNAPDGG